VTALINCFKRTVGFNIFVLAGEPVIDRQGKCGEWERSDSDNKRILPFVTRLYPVSAV